MITLETHKRKPGHGNVLGLAVEPLPRVNIEVVGMGERGLKALRRLTSIPGARVVAVKDTSAEHLQQGKRLLEQLQGPLPGCEKNEKTDLTYICTDWQSHTDLATEAMQKGHHVAIEVPAATTLDDIWRLVDTAEATRRHCMMLENCCYDYFEMATAAMAKAGMFGEIVHVEGGYGHPIGDKWTDWRLQMNALHRGDIYPTHGMGPACMVLDIHRNDRLMQLVSMDTASFTGKYAMENFSHNVKGYFKNGDQTTTLIRTLRGKTITLNHNVLSPRPYTRFYQIVGTRGFVQKDPTPIIIYSTPDGKNHRLQGDDCMGLIEQFLPKDILEWRNIGAQLDSRGGMAYHMDRRMIEHLLHGEPMDMDVYDMAEWCAVAPLSEISIENGFTPVSFPDFIGDSQPSQKH